MSDPLELLAELSRIANELRTLRLELSGPEIGQALAEAERLQVKALMASKSARGDAAPRVQQSAKERRNTELLAQVAALDARLQEIDAELPNKP